MTRARQTSAFPRDFYFADSNHIDESIGYQYRHIGHISSRAFLAGSLFNNAISKQLVIRSGCPHHHE
jgi:hypothetical protein